LTPKTPKKLSEFGKGLSQGILVQFAKKKRLRSIRCQGKHRCVAVCAIWRFWWWSGSVSSESDRVIFLDDAGVIWYTYGTEASGLFGHALTRFGSLFEDSPEGAE